LRITQITVHKFLYKYDFTVNLNQLERITIIHGPNGCGKTYLLKFLEFLFHRKFWNLREIPFQVVRIFFDSGHELRVYSTFFQMVKEFHNDQFYEKILTCGDIEDNITLYFEIQSQKDKNWRKIFALKETEFREIIPFDKTDPNEMIKQKERIQNYLIKYPDDVKNIKQVYEQISFMLDSRGKVFDKKTRKLIKEIPYPLKSLCVSIPMKFIQTQRIFSYDSKKEKQSVNEIVRCSKNLRKILELGQSIITKEKINFINSLQNKMNTKLNSEKKNFPTIDELKNNLKNRANWFEERLYWEPPYPLKTTEYPFFDIEIEKKLDNNSLDEEKKRIILELYLELLDNIIQSLKKYDSKFFLFQILLQKEFLHKEVVITNQGLELFYDHDTSSEIAPLKLSSGEQHIFIIIFTLIFKSKTNSLVLIDEPELSLHIHWQRKFLRILQKIISENPIDILIATHSPDIVFDRRDLSISLKGDK
jgi:ABC-type lipoprotein export system ATPase subunit